MVATCRRRSICRAVCITKISISSRTACPPISSRASKSSGIRPPVWSPRSAAVRRSGSPGKRARSPAGPIRARTVARSAIEQGRPAHATSRSLLRKLNKMRRFNFQNFSIAIAMAVAGALLLAPSGASAQTAGKTMTTASGLQIIDTTVGSGATPKPGQICVMHYTGWLYENGQKGKKFDSSVDRKEPFEFPIGQRKVIAGWDEGVATMKVGGKRTLIIPPALGYGARGAGGVIPPNATLMFDVELLDVKG